MAALRKRAEPAPAVRVSPDTHAKLLRLAKTENRPMGEIVTDLVDEYQTAKFWDEVNAALDRLRADPEDWQGYMDELKQIQAVPNAELAAEPGYDIEERPDGRDSRSEGR